MTEVKTNEKVKLDPAAYKRISEMLTSSDKESHVVALAILDQCSVKEDLPYLLLLYKRFGEANQDEWKNNAPKLMKNFKAEDVKLDIVGIAFKNIINITRKRYPKQEIQFILDEFAVDLKTHVIGWGMDFMTDIDIQLIDSKK